MAHQDCKYSSISFRSNRDQLRLLLLVSILSSVILNIFCVPGLIGTPALGSTTSGVATGPITTINSANSGVPAPYGTGAGATTGTGTAPSSSSGTTPLGYIAVPCDTYLTLMPFPTTDPISAQIANCVLPFPSCKGNCPSTGQCPGNATDDPGVISLVTDSLIRNVVEIRINNLYNGYNGLYTSADLDSNGKMIYPAAGADPSTTRTGSPYWNPQAIPVGGCHQSGACNLFCGEGPASTNLPVMSRFTKVIKEGSQGHFDDGQPLFINNTGGQSSKIEDGPNNVVDRAPSATDWQAKGSIDPSSSGYTAPKAPIAAGGTSAPPHFDGWPVHTWSGDASSTVMGCFSGVDADQSLIRIDSAKHSSDQDWGQYRFNIHSIVWDDSSYMPPMLQNGVAVGVCDLYYFPDFSTATTMTSLQIGALVQANWIALQEVIDEFSTTGRLNTPHSVCSRLASTLLGQVRQIIPTLLSSKLCGTSLAVMQADCLAVNGAITDTPRPAVQGGCFAAGLMSLITGTSFEQIAECEVYARANDIYDELFVNPGNGSSGAAMVSQLKNYAVAACLKGVLHNLNEGGDDEQQHSNRDNGAAQIEYMTSGSGSNSRLGRFLTNCFPYAYTSALQKYLAANPANPKYPFSTPVSIQGYTAGRTNDLGAGYSGKQVVKDKTGAIVPVIRLQNCQILDGKNPFASPSGVPHSRLEVDDANSSPKAQSVTSLALVGLGWVPLPRRHRKKIKKRKFSIPTENSLSYSLIFLSLLAVYLEFGMGCDQTPELDMYIMSFAVSQCVGLNGTLLTANGQSSTCCKYDRKAGTSNGGATLDFQSVQTVTTLAHNLHGVPITDSSDCPGEVDDIIVELGNLAVWNSKYVDAVISSISAINSTGQSNANINDFKLKAATTIAATPASQFIQSGFNYVPTSQNKGSNTAASAGAITLGGAGSNALKLAALKNNGLFSSVRRALGLEGVNTPPPTAIGVGEVADGTQPGSGSAGTSNRAGSIAGNNPESTGYSGPRGEVPRQSGVDRGDASEVTLDPISPFGMTRDPSAGGVDETLLDPDDYFTRLKASDDLFKVIERKYREKTPVILSEDQ